MVDILVAVYNGEKYLKEQLNSLLNQTYKDVNVIIRDDGSLDSSLEIIKDFMSRYPEKITLIEGTPSGSAKNNFFELMQHTTADYIMFCDQDDIWLPNKIELTLNKLQKTEETLGKDTPVLCHTDLTVVDKNLNELHKSFFKMQKFDITKTSLNRALVQNIVTGCTVMINKPLLNLAKGTNSENIIMHDWWLFLIASTFGKIEVINTPTILYRQHGTNQLGAKKISPLTRTQMTNSIKASINQAISFIQYFKNLLSPEQHKMLECYANIHKYSVFKKLSILQKYQLFKHPFIKKFFQIIIILKGLAH